MTRALLPLLAAALAAVAWPAPAARAAAYTYSSQQRTINAGILLVDDAGSGDLDGPVAPGPGASNPDPYIFYILNQRSDLKPFGWNVVNPIASPTVTGDILNRWNYRPAATGGGSSGYYQLNEPITPDMAPYWEVSLSKTTLPNLLQFDVLLINLGPGHTSVSFTDDEVHKLRRFVDAGGQLLVECSGGNINAPPASTPAPLFFPDSFTNSGGPNQPYIIPATNAAQLRHPIIAAPYLLSQQELNSLGNSSLAVLLYPSSNLFNAVLKGSQNGRLPALAAAQYGAGEVIMDATGSLATLNDSVPGYNGGYGTGLGYNGASNSGPRCEGPFTAAPASDLKLLADILSWTGAHPNEHKNSHQSSQSPAVVGPALAPTWTFKPTTPTGPSAPGAAINGNFVYVRAADGFLHAFNATPGTDILGTGDPDAGFQDFDLGNPYDEIWATNGHAFKGAAAPTPFQDLYASAPTVAAYGGTTYVFVEGSNGVVHVYNATDGTAPTAIPATIGTASGTYDVTTGPAPAPTFFDGHLYIGQQSGTLFVYDFAQQNPASTGAPIQFQTNAATSPVIAAPTVGIVRQNLTGLPGSTSAYSDDIIAAVTTMAGVYTLELGSRHDPLRANGTNYTVHSAQTQAFNIFSPSGGNTYPTLPYAYPITAGGYVNTPLAVTTPNGSGNGFTITAPDTYYGDYDVAFGNQPAPIPPNNTYALVRSEFVFGPSPAQQVSAPALTANGNLLYTANLTVGNNTDSTLVCAHDTRTNGNPGAQMQWRFRLPYTNEANGSGASIVDADGVAYDNLAGFQFFGAPVVDRNDTVFALADVPNAYPARVAVLCFSGDQRVTAQVAAAGIGRAQVNSVTQTVIGQTYDEFTNPAPAPAQGNTQFGTGIDNNGRITFRSFGAPNVIPGNPALAPNLAEPDPVSVTISVAGAANGGTPTPALLHTNLLWYAVLPTVPVVANGTTYPALPNLASLGTPTSGLTLVGNYLYYGDANGNLVRVYAYPQNASLINNRFAALSGPAYPVGGPVPANPAATLDGDQRAAFAYTPTDAGAIGGSPLSPPFASFGGVPSASNGVLIANGTAGVAALGSQNTLVADANRVVELDAEGVATWAVDATTQIGPNNTATHLDLSRPSAITQITANDYLVADTGNNRCVRFDRAGNVLWELTRFNDTPFIGTAANGGNNALTKPNRLLAPGEPTTLSRPASVDSYTQTFPDPQAPTSGYDWTAQHYLIADTGHYRILEVVDVFDQNGKPVGQPHNLVWISHTYDVQHRQYSYTGANYYHSYTSGQLYVAGLISNVRIAPLGAPLTTQAALPIGALAPAASDAPGASLVLLDYDPDKAHTATQLNGFIGVGSNASGANELRAFSSFSASINASNVSYPVNGFDLTGGVTGVPSTGAALRTLYFRNPRSLQTYTNRSATSGVTHFLLADDNGVFDLVPNQTPNAPPLQAIWGFTQGDYQAVRTPIDGITLAAVIPATNTSPAIPIGFDRTNIPFISTSLSRPSADTVTVGTSSYVVGHYVVTNGYSQGQVTPGVLLPGSTAASQLPTSFGGEALELHAVANGTTIQTQEMHGSTAPFSGTTLGKPSDTSPLSQPAFAAREK